MKYTSFTVAAALTSSSFLTCWAAQNTKKDGVADDDASSSLLSSLSLLDTNAVANNNKKKDKSTLRRRLGGGKSVLSNRDRIGDDDDVAVADLGILAVSKKRKDDDGEYYEKPADYDVGAANDMGDDEEAMVDLQRRLMIPDSSCDGKRACNFDASGDTYHVGEQSCNGDWACTDAAGFGGSFTVENYSCNSEGACFRAGNKGFFLAGKSSCIEGGDACCSAGQLGYAKIGSYSCYGQEACKEQGYLAGNEFHVGDQSCRGIEACRSQWDIDSLNIDNTYHDTVTIGSESCQGQKSCYNITDSTVGDYSCTCDYCCENLPPGSSIGNFQCTSLEDDCRNADTPLILADQLRQSLKIDGTELTVGSNTIDLSPAIEAAVDLELSISGTTLSINGGNQVDLSSAIRAVVNDMLPPSPTPAPNFSL